MGAIHGHTLLPRSLLTEYIKRTPVEADCPISNDVIDSLGPILGEIVTKITLADGRNWISTGSLY